MLTHPTHITLKIFKFGNAVVSSIDDQLTGFEIAS